MRKAIVSVMGLFLLASAGLAHDPAEEGEWLELEGWRLVSIAGETDSVVFFSDTLRKRVGSALQMEILVIGKTFYGQGDHENIHLLVDCSTLEYFQTGHQSFGPAGILPPSIIRTQPQSAPAQGTVIRDALEMGCGKKEPASVVVADPYAWAKRQLSKAGR